MTNKHVLVQFEPKCVPRKESDGSVSLNNKKQQEKERLTIVLDQKGTIVP